MERKKTVIFGTKTGVAHIRSTITYCMLHQVIMGGASPFSLDARLWMLFFRVPLGDLCVKISYISRLNLANDSDMKRPSSNSICMRAAHGQDDKL